MLQRFIMPMHTRVSRNSVLLRVRDKRFEERRGLDVVRCGEVGGEELRQRVVVGGSGGDGVVFLLVDGEVVAARESPVALRTVERTFSGVFPPVSRQLVGPRETPRTARPVAGVWLLARVLTDVRRQLRRLGVRASALGEWAGELLA